MMAYRGDIGLRQLDDMMMMVMIVMMVMVMVICLVFQPVRLHVKSIVFANNLEHLQRNVTLGRLHGNHVGDTCGSPVQVCVLFTCPLKAPLCPTCEDRTLNICINRLDPVQNFDSKTLTHSG